MIRGNVILHSRLESTSYNISPDYFSHTYLFMRNLGDEQYTCPRYRTQG
jgi:hypothetical protein